MSKMTMDEFKQVNAPKAIDLFTQVLVSCPARQWTAMLLSHGLHRSSPGWVPDVGGDDRSFILASCVGRFPLDCQYGWFSVDEAAALAGLQPHDVEVAISAEYIEERADALEQAGRFGDWARKHRPEWLRPGPDGGERLVPYNVERPKLDVVIFDELKSFDEDDFNKLVAVDD